MFVEFFAFCFSEVQSVSCKNGGGLFELFVFSFRFYLLRIWVAV
jgi:hypothetical protein